MENPAISKLLQKMMKKITELDIIEPKKNQFKEIFEFFDSFTKINSEYRLFFLLFKKYCIENDAIFHNINEQDVKLLLSLIEIDNNKEKEEELAIELCDEDELFREFYENFVQDGEYSSLQTIFAYYYYQISNDFQSLLESYILIKSQKDDYLIPIIPKDIPNITDNSALFFELFKQFEDKLLTDKNIGAYKIIIEKSKEKLFLNKANLENDEFEEHVNCDDDDNLKKIFKKKFPELFTLKNKKKLIKKKEEEEDRKSEGKEEESFNKKEDGKKNERMKIPDTKKNKDISHRNFENNKTIEIKNNEENNRSNEMFKGMDEMKKYLEKMNREYNEQKDWFNLEITKLNKKISKQNDKIEDLNSQNIELKSQVKKFRRKIKLITSKITKIQNENDKIKNRTACKSIIDYVYGS